MRRHFYALALLFFTCGSAQGAEPDFTADSVVRLDAIRDADEIILMLINPNISFRARLNEDQFKLSACKYRSVRATISTARKEVEKIIIENMYHSESDRGHDIDLRLGIFIKKNKSSRESILMDGVAVHPDDRNVVYGYSIDSTFSARSEIQEKLHKLAESSLFVRIDSIVEPDLCY